MAADAPKLEARAAQLTQQLQHEEKVRTRVAIADLACKAHTGSSP